MTALPEHFRPVPPLNLVLAVAAGHQSRLAEGLPPCSDLEGASEECIAWLQAREEQALREGMDAGTCRRLHQAIRT